MKAKKSFLKPIRGWLPKENNKIAGKMNPFHDIFAIERNRPEEKTAPSPLLTGLGCVAVILIVFYVWFDYYHSLWYLMIGGTVIGLILGSPIAVYSVRISVKRANRERSRSPKISLVSAAIMGDLFIMVLSYVLWLINYIQAELSFSLIFGSLGFVAGYFLAYGLLLRNLN